MDSDFGLPLFEVQIVPVQACTGSIAAFNWHIATSYSRVLEVEDCVFGW